MKKFRSFAPYLLILLLATVPLFAHLDSLPLQLWDESRLATNAYEMYKSDHLMVTTFQGEPDHWNTKPPLMIWSQYICMKIFGVSELAVRLPSALAGLMLFLSIAYFFLRMGLSWRGPVIICILLLISKGFNGDHGLRFGDYDALLSFFIVVQSLAFYLYTDQRSVSGRNKYLLVFFIAVVLAIWTKGVAGLILSPVFVGTWFWLKMWKADPIPRMILYSILTLAVALSYYVIRDQLDPGYIRVTAFEEITNRFVSIPDDTTKPWYYYFNLMPGQTGNWIFAVVPFIAAGIALSRKKMRQMQLYFLSCLLFFFTVIQNSDGKNFWYILPLYPLIYLNAGLSIETLYNEVSSGLRVQYRSLITLLMIAVFCFPYAKLVYNTLHLKYDPNASYGQYNVTYELRKQRNNPSWSDFVFIDTEYSANNWWYIERMKDQGRDIRFYDHLDSVGSGDLVLIREENVADSLTMAYRTEDLHLGKYNCRLLRLKEKR